MTLVVLYRCLKIRTGSIRIKFLHPDCGACRACGVNPEKIQPTRREEQSMPPGGSRLATAEWWLKTGKRGFIRPVTTLSVSESRTFWIGRENAPWRLV